MRMTLDPFVDYFDEATRLGKWAFSRRRKSLVLDNFVFLLHYRVSLSLFLLASLFVTIGLYIADPIECISDLWIQGVIDSYCWVHSTFTLPRYWNATRVSAEEGPPLAAHPGVGTQGENDPLKFYAYYQWICYLLLFQAILFYIPRGLWKYHLERGQVDRLHSLVLKDFCSSQNPRHNFNIDSKFLHYFSGNRKQHQSYFAKLVFCEMLNLAVTLLQMYLIRVTEFSYSDAIQFLTVNDPLEREDLVAQIFPKVTKCTFHTFGPSGSLQNHDALCVLPFNVINEKIYLGMWLWLALLASLSVLVLTYRLCLFIIPTFRMTILKYSTKHTEIESFGVLRKNLNIGDWMVLRQLSKNLDLMLFTNIVKSLDSKFRNSEISYK